MENFNQYCYKALVLNVVDGDTVDVLIDLGMNTHRKERLRIAGINTPETYGVKKDSEEYLKGIQATAAVKQAIMGEEVLIRTKKDKKGKYGRYIAEIFYGENNTNLGEQLVADGLAKEVKY